MIVVVDNKMGNIRSVTNALDVLNANYIVSQSPEDVKTATGVILPGVGHFEKAMVNLNESGFTSAIMSYAATGKPLLGICLGMQLLFSTSEEAENENGLSLIEGQVLSLKKQVNNLAVPHIGWNELKVNASTLLSGVSDGDCVYFVHSYAVSTSESNVIATTDYHLDITAAVQQGNIFGVQFHPEKSQKIGLTILENFIKLC